MDAEAQRWSIGPVQSLLLWQLCRPCGSCSCSCSDSCCTTCCTRALAAAAEHRLATQAASAPHETITRDMMLSFKDKPRPEAMRDLDVPKVELKVCLWICRCRCPCTPLGTPLGGGWP